MGKITAVLITAVMNNGFLKKIHNGRYRYFFITAVIITAVINNGFLKKINNGRSVMA